MRSDWERDSVATAWSAAVGDRGDIFQQLILKTWIAAVVRASSLAEREQVPKAFYDILAATLSDCQSGSIERCLDKMSAHLDDIVQSLGSEPKLRVLDLGGGEGFIGRWLAPILSRYTVIDVSGKLIDLGRRKWVAADVGVEWLRGDFDDRSLAGEAGAGFGGWLDGLPGAPSDVSPGRWSASDFDIVLCTNVVDHLERPENFLRSLAVWLGAAAKRPALVLTTLNPDFFVGARPRTYPSNAVAVQSVSLGPAGQQVSVYPRSWLQAEHLLSAAGFNICACETAPMSQYPPEVQKSFLELGRLEHAPAAGPFILWLLTTARHGTPLTAPELKELSVRFPFLRPLRQDLEKAASKLAGAVSRLHFGPDELIAYPSNPPHGIFIVEENAAQMEGRSGLRQIFGRGDAFGELETGEDIYVSRFLYPVRAGGNGCTVLRIEKHAFAYLLDHERVGTLGDAFYALLRDRVSTYSWVYHRSTYPEKETRKITEGVNHKECESLARILLFACTMEAGRLRRQIPPATEHDGISTLILLLKMRGAIEDAQVTSKSTAYRAAIQLFHALGIVDIYEPTKARAVPFAQLFADSRDRMLRMGARLILLPRLREACPDYIEKLDRVEEEEFVQRPRDASLNWPYPSLDWQLFSKQIASLKEDELSLQNAPTRFAKDFIDAIISKDINANHHLVRVAVYSFMYNMAFLSHEFYAREQTRFFVVHDLYFLRRIAMGGMGWENELRSRIAASSHMLEGKVYNSLGSSEEWRVSAYLRRFECFVENYWASGSHVRHSHDSLLQDLGLVHKALERDGLTVLPAEER
jgi:2-polyprenyl-3-methyl-5-hydroxy-6-metoxy-1,4-benzoquinol methylase